MRRWLSVVALTGVLITSSPAAGQEGQPSSTQDPPVRATGEQVIADRTESGGTSGGDTPLPVPSAGGGDDEPTREQAIWLFTVGGAECWRVVSVTAGTTPVDIPAGTPPCDPADAVAPITPEEWVESYVETTAPQRPVPGFIPPQGITGEPMYLLTIAPLNWRHETDDTPFGPLLITGDATVVVDWGDGDEPLRYPVVGEAWPDGEIVHTWTDVGDYDITVTYEWDLDWTFASANGQLPLPHTETIADYPVIELQPVIRRP